MRAGIRRRERFRGIEVNVEVRGGHDAQIERLVLHLLRPKYCASTNDGALVATMATSIIDRVTAPANRRI